MQLPRSVWDPSVELDGAGPAWYELAALTSLDLSQNLLRRLPDQLAEIATLRVLKCSGNELQQLPDALTALEDLRLLDVSANQCAPSVSLSQLCEATRSLQCTPTELQRQVQVSASLCRLTGALDCVADVRSLAKLIVSDNPLTHLPDELGGHQGGLSEVVADRCKLAELPAGLARAAGLLRLSCTGNELREANANVLAGAPRDHVHADGLYRASICLCMCIEVHARRASPTFRCLSPIRSLLAACPCCVVR